MSEGIAGFVTVFCIRGDEGKRRKILPLSTVHSCIQGGKVLEGCGSVRAQEMLLQCHVYSGGKLRSYEQT